MKIRYKILVLLISILLSLIVAQYLLGRKSILSNLNELELNICQGEIERVVNAIQQELEHLDTLAFNLAGHNEIYKYVSEKNISQETLLWGNQIFELLRINLIIIADSHHQIRFQKCYDYVNRKELQIPELAQNNVPLQFSVFNHTTPTGSVKGIVLLNSGIMLMAARPILTDKTTEPIRGTLVMGRFLDVQMINRLSTLIQVKFSVLRTDNPDLPAEIKSLIHTLQSNKIVVLPLNQKIVTGYALINDLREKEGIILKVEIPRYLYKRIWENSLFIMFTSIMVGIIFCLVVVLLLEKIVLSRLASLSREVTNIDLQKNHTARLSDYGKDELGELAFNINTMLESLEKAHTSIHEMARTDALTGLLNRWEFFRRGEEELNRARRYSRVLSLAMLDLDHFKQINDKFGHLAGDEVLKAFAQLIKQNVRNTDIVARYGGEEFVIIMPETMLHSAALVCERLRQNTENYKFTLSTAGTQINCTVSIGLAGLKENESLDDLVRRTDEALYSAKNKGRNRVCLATVSGITELSAILKAEK
ncbi:MAG: diguanylate cyclase [Candidatus Sumerlaeia bacterium]|nr:diguanylate cyclase [Candidatus Sumerlaeia bacterium]